MSRCCACTAENLIVVDTDSIDLTLIAPSELHGDVRIDPNPTNQLSVSATGLFVPPAGGGGGGFPDLIQIFNDATFSTVTESGDDLILLDPAANGGVTFRNQGTALSWGGAGNESKVVVNTTGYYSIHSVLVCAPGTEGMSFTTTLYINGAPQILDEFGPAWLDVLASGGVSSHTILTKIPLTAADVIEAHATQVGNVSNDNQVAGYYLVVSRDL